MTGLDFGIWLRRRRLALGWSLDEAVVRTGCFSRSTLYRIESGEQNAIGELLALLEAYGVDVEGIGFVSRAELGVTKNGGGGKICGTRGACRETGS